MKPGNHISAAAYRQLMGLDKDPRRQQQGRTNKAQGASFEDYIQAGCDYYRAQGLADIRKTPERVKILQRLEQGRFICCFAGKAEPDFNGVLQGGRSVCFEAKHTGKPELYQKRVTPVQTEILDHKLALGALCFVVAGLGGEAFRLPWPVWREMRQHFSRKYVRPDELQQYRLPLGPAGAVLFLAGLKS